MEKQILEIMRMVLGTDAVSTSTSWENCESWDSLSHLNLIVELGDAFGVEFKPKEIAEMISYEAVKRIIESKTQVS